MLNFEELKDIIINNHSFLLTTHVNPDADAIGSCMALYRILRHWDKRVTILNYSQTPNYLAFLDEENVINTFDPLMHSKQFDKHDVIIALDFNRADRIVKMEPLLRASKSLKVCIDHHLNPESIFDYYYCEPEYCATGHIIYDFIKQTNITPWNYKIALPLYAAIMTDTGSFRYERTTPEVHIIAAHLIKLGVVPIDIQDKIFNSNSIGKFQLMGKALSTLKLYGKKNQLSTMMLMKKDFDDAMAEENDTEGFVNLLIAINGVKMGMFFIEVKEGFKVSLRSKYDVDCSAFASKFGGGGHKFASGIRIRNESLDDRMPSMIKEAIKFISSGE
ncbi:MAG: bifunctional oligoribonuclease/PAP phosphatase NrnA [Ignavibacteriaceae bacterium]|nr:bifunctional oligoribonuclease/PAP phosphatase NrnA [Ignavibacteriaceae bacterium]